jgi:hypothetical protein
VRPPSGSSSLLPAVSSGTKRRFSLDLHSPTVQGLWKDTSTASSSSNDKRMAEPDFPTCNTASYQLPDRLGLEAMIR